MKSALPTSPTKEGRDSRWLEDAPVAGSSELQASRQGCWILPADGANGASGLERWLRDWAGKTFWCKQTPFPNRAVRPRRNRR